MPRDFNELEPWEQWERIKKEAEEQFPESLPESGERLLTFWKNLLMGTSTAAALGASPATIARTLKVLSDADLLLSRLVGFGAIRVGLWFDPKLALERADDLEGKYPDGSALATLRSVAEAWQDDPGLEDVPPTTAHFLMAAMLYWAQGNEFAWPLYEKMMPRLFSVTFAELLQRLHMIPGPDSARMASVNATIDALAAMPVKVAAPVFVRFENRGFGLKTKDFGPYAWVEIVHDELKVAPTGRHLATLVRVPDAEEGAPSEYWAVADPSVGPREAFTNVVIGPAEVPDGWVQPSEQPEEGPAA